MRGTAKFVLGLHCNEHLDGFKKQLNQGLQDYKSACDALNKAIRLECQAPTVRSTHEYRNKPKYEDQKYKAMHAALERASDAILKRTNISQRSTSPYWTTAATEDEQTIRGRLADPECSGFVRPYVFLNFGISKAKGPPKMDTSMPTCSIYDEPKVYEGRFIQEEDI